MTNYAAHVSRKTTPQTERAHPSQEPNSGGGYSFTIGPFEQLTRWLILGAEGGSYYSSEKTLTKENAEVVDTCLRADYKRAIQQIVDVSHGGRAPKNDPAIFALALAASFEGPHQEEVRELALRDMPLVCRTGTHLFQFARSVNELRGWGHGLRKSVSRWYEERSEKSLLVQLTKYQQREGWSHRDLLRLAHVKASSPGRQAAYRWATGGAVGEHARGTKTPRAYQEVILPAYLEAFEVLKHTTDEKAAVRLITEHGFTHEMLPSELKNSRAVWEALYPDMGATALIRNLNKMTALGLLAPLSEATKRVCARLQDREELRRGRIHPVKLLSALRTYQKGRGELGSLSWTPVGQISAALEEAFYLSFGVIEPAGKRMMIALDISGSMGATSSGAPGLTSREASAAMAMTMVRSEPEGMVVGFSHKMVQLPITSKTSLQEAIAIVSKLPFGATDCALPMVGAQHEKLTVDAFQVYTDNETNFGHIHPHQALKSYRASSGIPATLAVIACTPTKFTIADPTDPGQLDVCGFDTATPAILTAHARGWQSETKAADVDAE